MTAVSDKRIGQSNVLRTVAVSSAPKQIAAKTSHVKDWNVAHAEVAFSRQSWINPIVSAKAVFCSLVFLA